VAVPPAIPVTTPDAGITSAIDAEELLHVPPEILLDNTVEEPSQNIVVPVIADGDKLTVTVDVVQQPELKVKVIDAVPGVIPLTIPVVTPTVATEGFPLLHVPLPVALVKEDELPVQIFMTPTVAYNMFTVTTAVDLQPVANV
jgi:hypothetical protein